MEYPQLLAIANTLTDSTVADPATRADLLTMAGDLVDAAQLSVDDAGVILEEQPYIFKPILPDVDLPVKGLKPGNDTAPLQAQTAELQSDLKSIKSYTRFVTTLEENIGTAAAAAADSTTTALASAAEKGATLAWEKAPAETAAVVAAAAALTADGVADLPLEERATLVSRPTSRPSTPQKPPTRPSWTRKQPRPPARQQNSSSRTVRAATTPALATTAPGTPGVGRTPAAERAPAGAPIPEGARTREAAPAPDRTGSPSR